jgi:hypothetical protein
MTTPTWEDLEGTVVDVVAENGVAKGRDAHVHPGALLVAWQHYGPTQLAFKGIAPGRRFSTIAVVSEYDPPDPVENAENALDIAVQYAADHHPELRGQPILVDVPGDEGEIRSALEDEAMVQANRSFVEGLSTPGDLLQDDLEEQGYDPDSITIIATAGDAVAVNGDLIVGPNWEDLLGLEKKGHAQLWTEARPPGPATKVHGPASWRLEDWLIDNGYDRLDRLGGEWPGGEEQEVSKEYMIENVAEEKGIPEKLVADVADVWKGDYVMWGSDSGSSTVYAKKKHGVKKARKARKR